MTTTTPETNEPPKDAAGSGSVDGLLAVMREARDRMTRNQVGSEKWWIALSDLRKAERDYYSANALHQPPPADAHK